MVCKECEKSIARNSNYCKYCGTKVEKAAEQKATEVSAEKIPVEESPLIFREVEVTQDEADAGAERVLDFAGAIEPLHIRFPKLFCTGQLFMVKKYKFLNAEGRKCKKNILIRVNIA